MMLACAQEKMQGAAIMSSSKTMAEAAAMASAAAASVNATQVIHNARIDNVGKAQSCMVSKSGALDRLAVGISAALRRGCTGWAANWTRGVELDGGAPRCRHRCHEARGE